MGGTVERKKLPFRTRPEEGEEGRGLQDGAAAGVAGEEAGRPTSRPQPGRLR